MHSLGKIVNLCSLEMIFPVSNTVGPKPPSLVDDVKEGDVVVVLDDALVVGEEVGDVGDGGGRPAAPLVVELGEALGARGERVAGGRVLHSPPLLQQQRAQPPEITLKYKLRLYIYYDIILNLGHFVI